LLKGLDHASDLLIARLVLYAITALPRSVDAAVKRSPGSVRGWASGFQCCSGSVAPRWLYVPLYLLLRYAMLFIIELLPGKCH
jgi:hypothetical protein